MKIFAYLLITSLAILSGCTTISDVSDSKGQGKTQTFNRSYDSVWKAAQNSIDGTGLRIVSSDKDTGTILSTNSRTLEAFGENVGVFVTSNNDSSTSVEVVSLKIVATNLQATDWTEPILARIKNKLGQDHPKADNRLPEKWVVQSAYDKLSKKEKEQLEQNYNLNFYNDDEIGLITERQVENISTAGSAAGSEVGSALASTVYINNALNSASYNVWTDLSVGIMGAVAGSGANKAPVKKYIIKYTVRNLNDQIKSTEVTQSSPIGESIGVCFSLSKRIPIENEFCTMTAEDIRKKYLAKNK